MFHRPFSVCCQLLWLVGLMIVLKDLSPCPEVKSWLRFILWLRALMPLLVLCCIIPIQQLCCEALGDSSCFVSMTELCGAPMTCVTSIGENCKSCFMNYTPSRFATHFWISSAGSAKTAWCESVTRCVDMPGVPVLSDRSMFPLPTTVTPPDVLVLA